MTIDQSSLTQVVKDYTPCPVCFEGQTDDTGVVIIQFQIPGTFSGFNGFVDPISNGRYFNCCEVWADIGENGDKLKNLCIKDIDGIIPVDQRIAFPNYPVIGTFFDTSMTETSTVIQGLQLRPGKITEICHTGIVPDFLPAGLYVYGEIHTATATAGKWFRGNFYMSKKEDKV